MARARPSCHRGIIEALEPRQLLSTVGVATSAPAHRPHSGGHALSISQGARPGPRRLLVRVGWSGPVSITHGGIYTGRWRSLDPNTPAVTIDTTEPVFIVNSSIRSAGDGIIDGMDGVNVTVLRTTGWGLNPEVVGRRPGRFVSIEHFVRIDIENCTLAHTSGIYLGYYIGSHTPDTSVKVLRNTALDIDGRFSNGQGGFLTGPDDHDDVQFCQLAYVQGVPDIEIAWNQVVNQPYQSRVEDNISIFRSSGTADSPIRIHDNYIQGAYAADPATQDYSGGGIMLADGAASTPDQECAYVQAYDNQVVSTTNYGISITTGHDSSFYDNRIVSSGYLGDGTWIAAQNVGASVWNSDADPLFANNLAYANVIGWMHKDGAGLVSRNDDWASPALIGLQLNIDLPGLITRQTESNEYFIWVQKLAQNHVRVGTTPTTRRLAALGRLTPSNIAS